MKYLIGLFLFSLLISCNSEKDEATDLTELIPTNSIYILDTPHIDDFLRQSDTVQIFQTYAPFLTSQVKAQLKTLINSINSRSAIISFTEDGNEQLNYIFISKEHPGEIVTDSIKNKSLETLTYENFIIQKYVIEDITIYKAEKNGVFIAGSSRQQLEEILNEDYRGLAKDELFVKAHSAIDKNKTSLLLYGKALSGIINQSFANVSLPPNDLARWSVIEFDFTNNALSLNGISTWDITENFLLEIFKNSGTQVNEIAKITPRDAKGFFSFTYQDIDVVINNLKKFNDSTTVLPGNHFLHYTGEAGLITLINGSKIPVIKASDSELAKELLIPMEEASKFRENTIYRLPENWDTFSHLYPLLPEINTSYYIWIDNFMIFAENPTDLESLISSYLNNLSLDQQEYYSEAMENLAAASSLLIVANNQIKTSKKSENSSEETQDPSYPVISLQFVVENDFAHLHGTFGLPDGNPTTAANQIATISLGAPLNTAPFLVKNHLSKQPEVIFQDDGMMLYLYSATGDLIWKKQLPHLISGEIQQVDISKNGNLQYAFTTPYALYVIDRKGNPVKPFPLEFKDEVTQPLSVFDYDNDRTYRFVLTQGNNVIMYDSKGKLVKGFDFDKLSSEILQAPKHIRLNNKDYIIVPEASGKLNILSRQGKSRIDVKEDIDFSATPWFQYKNNFISISSKGKLVTINEQGNVSDVAVGENGNVKLSANNNLLVTMADNTLKIGDQFINLDYGLYTSPQIFNSGNKTYISITDTQAKRVYIFDEKANLLPGFPLYGNSEIKILKDGSSNVFSVMGDEKEIILYQF